MVSLYQFWSANKILIDTNLYIGILRGLTQPHPIIPSLQSATLSNINIAPIQKKKFTSPRIPKLKKTTDLIPTEFETYDESYTRGFNIWLSCFKYKTRKNPINLLLHVTWHQHLLNISSTVWGRRESMSSWWWSFNKIKL